MSASPTQRRIAGSREASTIRTRRSRRRFALERLEERTLLAGGITGFGPGWQGNGTNGGPVIAPTTLTLTDGLNDENRSAYFTTPQPIGDWNASFVYTPTEPGGIGLADGVTFILQNEGLDALGNPVHLGSGLGMYQIAPSAEVEFNVYNGHTIGTNFETNGANSQNYNPTGAVNLASQDPILVALSYDGTTLTEKLTDQTTSATFTTSYTTNLVSVLGGSTALVGFTGSTGDGISTQTISNFSFQVASVGITKLASQPTVNPGGTETYNVSVTNSGSLGSVGTTVTDPLPAGTRFLSQTNPGAPWTETDPGLLNAGTVTFTDPGSLPSGTTANFTITVLVDSGPTRLTNTATVTSADSLPSSDTALVSVTAQTITPGPAVTINSVEGFNYVNAIVGTFTFPLPASTGTLPAGLPASDFTASIDWGDPSVDASAGTIIQDASNPSVYFITGTHTFPENGTFTVASSIRFIGGSYTTTISGIPVTISLPPSGPTAGTAATASVTQGPLAVSAFPIVGTEAKAIAAGPIATFIDAGGAGLIGDYSATISIVTPGGNTVVGPIAAASITQNGNAAQYTVNAPTFTIPEEGTYQVVVAVTDSGGVTPITVKGSSYAVIADAALTAVTGVALTPAANTGVLFTNSLVGKFTDANTTATTADFTAVIDWGDGSATSLGTIVSTGAGAFSVDGTHAYTKFGTYTTTVNVTDAGGSTVTLTGTSTVTDLAPTGVPTTFTAVEGQSTGSIVLATITDSDPLATAADLSASIVNWGDGTPSTPQPLAVVLIGGTSTSTIFQVVGSHTYLEEGLGLPVTLTVTTTGGVATTFTPATGTANVVDAALTSSNGTEITGIEGSPTVEPAAGTLLGTFTDANQAATVADFTAGGGSIVVNWGDGSAPQTLAASNLTKVGSPNGVIFEINASHTYAEEGTYAYTVTVADDGGATTVISGSAIIADAALSPSPTQPTIDTIESGVFPVPAFGKPVFYNQPVASFTDANSTAPLSDFTATIDWGDGTPLSAGTITQTGGIGNSVFFVSGSHTYADAGVNGGVGTYPVQVFIVDTGGSRLTVTNIANVADRPIVLTGQLNPTSDSGLSTGTVDTTNVKQPDFIGSSEAFSHVSLFAAAIGGGPLVPIGQVQAGSDGSWNAISNVPLADGSYVITATAVDQFGMTTAGPTTITSNLVIDTVGPVITNVVWNRLNGQVDYVIQDPSPGSGVDVASLLNSANYEFTKVHANKAFPGKWIVTNIGVTPGAAPLSYDVAVTFNDGATIRGGFYIFTIRDSSNGDSSVQDLAENHLDGVFYGSFPSGNGVNGSDFVAMLSGFHNKIFSPQTIVGTASAANGGVGGPRIGAVHSGHFTPVIPRGGSPVFDANRSASKSQKVDKLHKAAKLREAARHHEKAARHEKAVASNHPHGPLHS